MAFRRRVKRHILPPAAAAGEHVAAANTDERDDEDELDPDQQNALRLKKCALAAVVSLVWILYLDTTPNCAFQFVMKFVPRSVRLASSTNTVYTSRLKTFVSYLREKHPEQLDDTLPPPPIKLPLEVAAVEGFLGSERVVGVSGANQKSVGNITSHSNAIRNLYKTRKVQMTYELDASICEVVAGMFQMSSSPFRFHMCCSACPVLEDYFLHLL